MYGIDQESHWARFLIVSESWERLIAYATNRKESIYVNRLTKTVEYETASIQKDKKELHKIRGHMGKLVILLQYFI